MNSLEKIENPLKKFFITRITYGGNVLERTSSIFVDQFVRYGVNEQHALHGLTQEPFMCHFIISEEFEFEDKKIIRKSIEITYSGFLSEIKKDIVAYETKPPMR
jgi:hypothetical protein